MGYRSVTATAGGARAVRVSAAIAAIGLALVAARASAAAGAAQDASLATVSPFNSYLKGVAAVPGGGAWAVGTDLPPAVNSKGLIERWNGSSWRVVAGPHLGGATTSSALSGVAAVSTTNAWAVGNVSQAGVVTQTLIDHWNGKSWKRAPSPNPGGSPGVSSLAAVTARSPSDAWAVGYYLTSNIIEPFFQQTLIEHWNGKTWLQAPSPSPGPADSALLGVAAVSPTSAWAVGTYTDVQGYDQTLIEHWNGKAWTQVPSPSPGGPSRSNLLFGVTATSGSDVIAVGVYVGSLGDETLVEQWNGKVWKQVASPNGPPGATGSFLYGVAAASSSSAWAVGTYVDSKLLDQTLIEQWNGKTWKRSPSQNPGGPASANMLEGVAAASAGRAWATGFYQKGGYPDRTLAEIWNGRTWRTTASRNS